MSRCLLLKALDVFAYSCTHDTHIRMFPPETRKSTCFIGRQHILGQIHTHLAQPLPLQPVILIGPAGIGKTQTAIEYVHKYHGSYRMVLWVDGSNLDTIELDFNKFAKRFVKQLENCDQTETPMYKRLKSAMEQDPSSQDKVSRDHSGSRSKDTKDQYSANMPERHFKSSDFELSPTTNSILDWMADVQNENWLFVFDNVDDLESFDIRHFFPVGGKKPILITSRRPELNQLGMEITIPELSDDEAFSLLLKVADKKGDLGLKGKWLGMR